MNGGKALIQGLWEGKKGYQEREKRNDWGSSYSGILNQAICISMPISL